MQEAITNWVIATNLYSTEDEVTISLALTYLDEEGKECEVGPCRIDEKQLIELRADIENMLALFAEHR